MVNTSKEVLILLLAAIFDRSLGDPKILPHPVQLMGWIISSYTRMVISRSWGKQVLRSAGFFLGIGSIASSAIIAYLIIAEANRFFIGNERRNNYTS